MLVNFWTRECVRGLAPHIWRSVDLGVQQKCSLDFHPTSAAVQGARVKEQGGEEGPILPGQSPTLSSTQEQRHLVPPCAPTMPSPVPLPTLRPACSLPSSRTSLSHLSHLSSLSHKYSHHDVNHFCAFFSLLLKMHSSPLCLAKSSHPARLSQSPDSSFMWHPIPNPSFYESPMEFHVYGSVVLRSWTLAGATSYFSTSCSTSGIYLHPQSGTSWALVSVVSVV